MAFPLPLHTFLPSHIQYIAFRYFTLFCYSIPQRSLTFRHLALPRPYTSGQNSALPLLHRAFRFFSNASHLFASFCRDDSPRRFSSPCRSVSLPVDAFPRPRSATLNHTTPSRCRPTLCYSATLLWCSKLILCMTFQRTSILFQYASWHRRTLPIYSSTS